MPRTVTKTCSIFVEEVQASQARDLRTVARIAPLAGSSEHTGGGSPTFTKTPLLPLLETKTKQELAQPASPTAMSRTAVQVFWSLHPESLMIERALVRPPKNWKRLCVLADITRRAGSFSC